jgi:hypothetical protein
MQARLAALFYCHRAFCKRAQSRRLRRPMLRRIEHVLETPLHLTPKASALSPTAKGLWKLKQAGQRDKHRKPLLIFEPENPSGKNTVNDKNAH